MYSSLFRSLALSAMLVLHGYERPNYSRVWEPHWYSPTQFKHWVVSQPKATETSEAVASIVDVAGATRAAEAVSATVKPPSDPAKGPPLQESDSSSSESSKSPQSSCSGCGKRHPSSSEDDAEGPSKKAPKTKALPPASTLLPPK